LTVARNEPVTIGLPFHNCETTLAYALQSVFAQTDPHWQLLLIDDGSTDGSLAIARQVRDPRVAVISDGVNRGLPYRLNQIAALSQGRYLARMDGDDLMHPDRLRRQRDFLQRHPGVDAVGTPAFIIDARNEVTGRRGDARFDPSPRAVLERGLFIHPTVMGSRDWFRCHPYDPSYIRAEDRELWCRAAGKATFARLNDPLLFYREPQAVNVGNYLQSCATDRRILQRYGPDLVGAVRTRTLIARSYLKSTCYRTAELSGRASLLVRRRNRMLTPMDQRAATDIVQRILSTPVPGLRSTVTRWACGVKA
jgi:glycosyltransferase involved in cell wall biosynthesis